MVVTQIPFSTGLTANSTTPTQGSVRFNTTTNSMEMWAGTGWLAVTTGHTEPRNLIFDTGTVYGARYYTVKPEGYNWYEIMEWVVETFGPSAHDGVWTPGMRWYANNAKFWFRNQKDLDWFTLRWSS